jgi:hypothetical protein
VGAANEIISSGRISGTPPTRVDTTCKPAHAASSIAIPNASVSEVFRKIEPCRRTCIQVSHRRRGRIKAISAYRRHVPVCNRAEHGDSILQEMGFPHLEEIDHFGPVTACVASCRNERNHSEGTIHSPTTKRTLGNAAHMRGAVATRRSTPFL